MNDFKTTTGNQNLLSKRCINTKTPTDIKNEVDKYKKCKQKSSSIVLAVIVFELYIIKQKREFFNE